MVLDNISRTPKLDEWSRPVLADPNWITPSSWEIYRYRDHQMLPTFAELTERHPHSGGPKPVTSNRPAFPTSSFDFNSTSGTSTTSTQSASPPRFGEKPQGSVKTSRGTHTPGERCLGIGGFSESRAAVLYRRKAFRGGIGWERRDTREIPRVLCREGAAQGDVLAQSVGVPPSGTDHADLLCPRAQPTPKT